MKYKKFILASQSVGRKKLLEDAGFSFDIIPSTINEDLVKSVSPEEEIRLRAKLKGEDVKRIIQSTNAFLILSADSGTILDAKHFEKPKDFDDGMRIFRILSGKKHKSMTAFQLIFLRNGKEIRRINDEDVSWVTFNKLTDEQIKTYLIDNPNFTKNTGGYAINSQSEKIIKKIEGSVSNVIGLPMEKIIPIIRNSNW